MGLYIWAENTCFWKKQGGRLESPRLLEVPPGSHLLRVIGELAVHLASGWNPNCYLHLEHEAIEVENSGLERHRIGAQNSHSSGVWV